MFSHKQHSLTSISRIPIIPSIPSNNFNCKISLSKKQLKNVHLFIGTKSYAQYFQITFRVFFY